MRGSTVTDARWDHSLRGCERPGFDLFCRTSGSVEPGHLSDHDVVVSVLIRFGAHCWMLVVGGPVLMVGCWLGVCSCEIVWLVLLPKVRSSMLASMTPRWRTCKHGPFPRNWDVLIWCGCLVG
jgi:hypothetical protein